MNGRIRGRRGARLAAITSGGAIPETAAYPVVVEPEGKTVGSLDEDFAIESLTGDVFLLGTYSWRIRHVMGGKVYVHCAYGRHRGPAMGSCVLIAQGYEPEEAMKIVVERRAVADPHIPYIRSRILHFARQWGEMIRAQS